MVAIEAKSQNSDWRYAEVSVATLPKLSEFSIRNPVALTSEKREAWSRWGTDVRGKIQADLGLDRWESPENPYRFLPFSAPMDCQLELCARRSDVICLEDEYSSSARDTIGHLLTSDYKRLTVGDATQLLKTHMSANGALAIRVARLDVPPEPKDSTRRGMLSILRTCEAALGQFTGDKVALTRILDRVAHASESAGACMAGIGPEMDTLEALCLDPKLGGEIAACEVLSGDPAAGLNVPPELQEISDQARGKKRSGRTQTSQSNSNPGTPTLEALARNFQAIESRIDELCGPASGRCQYRTHEARAMANQLLSNACVARVYSPDPYLVASMQTEGKNVVYRQPAMDPATGAIA
ncbi:MAG: hypothetical protein AAB425_12430, partial [Bdellovibrionota bacterium]